MSSLPTPTTPTAAPPHSFPSQSPLPSPSPSPPQSLSPTGSQSPPPSPSPSIPLPEIIWPRSPKTPPPPLKTFNNTYPPLPPPLQSALHPYPIPTPIQCAAIPPALLSRDVIAVSKTGSGKTLAYAIPLLAHTARQQQHQPQLNTRRPTPVALVLAPTRELAAQIGRVLRPLAAALRLAVALVVGGCSRFRQLKRVREKPADVLVCTPGRLADLVTAGGARANRGGCLLNTCSFVVVDEADRMLDFGFEAQVRNILSMVRKDAQRLLFSATFPTFVRRLAAELLVKPVRLGIYDHPGQGGRRDSQFLSMVCDTVAERFVLVRGGEEGRVSWLLGCLKRLLADGLVIVFCSTRGTSAQLSNRIRATGVPAACIHGETEQSDREGLLGMFRKGEIGLLVTTDLSARGLDIVNVRTVINFECAKSWEWHVHRVGRTGRAGLTGSAFTLVCGDSKSDMAFVAEATRAYRSGRVMFPPGLEDIERLEMAMDRARGRGGGKKRKQPRFATKG